METTLRLAMNFKLEDGSNVTLTLNDPKGSIQEAEIKSAMELIIAKDIFQPKQVSIIEAVSAKVVQTDTTEFDLVV